MVINVVFDFITLLYISLVFLRGFIVFFVKINFTSKISINQF